MKRQIKDEMIATIILTGLFGSRVSDKAPGSLIYQIEEDDDVLYALNNRVVDIATELFRSNPQELLRSRIVGVLKEAGYVKIKEADKQSEVGTGKELDEGQGERYAHKSGKHKASEGNDNR